LAAPTGDQVVRHAMELAAAHDQATAQLLAAEPATVPSGTFAQVWGSVK
jgi:hypothetical protein